MRLGDETRDTPFDGHFAELMSALPPKADIGTQPRNAPRILSCRALRTHRPTFSNGAENEIVAERRIVKAEACERADRWRLRIYPRCRLIRQRFLPEQVLALKFRVRPRQSMV
jgi:hypothetical protein